jgi:hypothetical protein
VEEYRSVCARRRGRGENLRHIFGSRVHLIV